MSQQGANVDISMQGMLAMVAGLLIGGKRVIAVSGDLPVGADPNTGDFLVEVNQTVAGPLTIPLPAASGLSADAGSPAFLIYDGKGDAATNNITLDAGAGQKINGAQTLVIALNNGAAWIFWTGTQWIAISLNGGAAAMGVGDMILAAVQTVTGAKSFADGKFLLSNVAGTFFSTIKALATAARTITFPDASGTVPLLSLAQVWTAIQTFNAGFLKINNAGNTFATLFASLATAARTITFPDVTGTAITSGDSNTVTGPLLAASAIRPAAVTGHNNVGACTATGVKVGDTVISMFNITDNTNDNAKFESTITVNDQIQQTNAGDLSAKKYQLLVVAKS